MPSFPSPRIGLHNASSPVRRLQIFVLFDGQEATGSALRTAAAFVSGLGGDILIAAPQLVPYPLPLNCPDIKHSALLAQIETAVARSGVTCTIERVLISYSRDKLDGWRVLLPQHCIVVVGKPKRLFGISWFRAMLTAKSLKKLGHEVLVT